jgi:mono/diheme cytochrome c family protein
MKHGFYSERGVAGRPGIRIACAGLLSAVGALVGEGCQSISREESPATPAPSAAANLPTEFFAAHCYDCHGIDVQKGGLDFEGLLKAHGTINDLELLDKVIQAVSSGQMPPKNKPEPAEVETFVAALQAERAVQLAALKPAPGHVTVRRLNRVEYNNTVRDLLGVVFAPSDAFPPDDTGYGFDNIGDVLTLSPLLAEKYLDVAERIVGEALTRELAEYGKVSPANRRILVCNHALREHDEQCAERTIKSLAPRAYRRPVSKEELQKFRDLYQVAIDAGDGFESGIGLVLQAMLVSPHFLFRVEGEKAPADLEAEFRIANYDYASRLSYFLWSSMPDDALMACAKDGTIRHPRTLREQVSRMLRDPRASALAENFGGQWLQIRNLTRVDPDPTKFPQFTGELREAMATETNLFFESIVKEDRSLLNFIDADYTFVNEALAKHYGIDGIVGPEFQRVTVDPNERGGLLGQASVLTVTSLPTRTSPVIRGLWVLENMLDSAPPPPPPDVPPLDDAKVEATATLRQKLEAHRANPSCASCHDRMDPLGFGLENYDAIGAWRAEDNKQPVDSSGVLPDGQTFAGPGELKQVLLARKTDFTRCLTEKMLTYALGRGVEDFDTPVIDDIVAGVERSDYRFSALIYEIVRSLPFTKQQGEAS